MFQFPSLASGTYVFSDGSRGFAAGFPFGNLRVKAC